jgi:hypothetical protein
MTTGFFHPGGRPKWRKNNDTNYYRALYDYYRSEAGYLYALGKNLKDEYGR